MDENRQNRHSPWPDDVPEVTTADRALLDGWIVADGPWSSAGTPADPSSGAKPWRREPAVAPHLTHGGPLPPDSPPGSDGPPERGPADSHQHGELATPAFGSNPRANGQLPPLPRPIRSEAERAVVERRLTPLFTDPTPLSRPAPHGAPHAAPHGAPCLNHAVTPAGSAPPVVTPTGTAEERCTPGAHADLAQRVNGDARTNRTVQVASGGDREASGSNQEAFGSEQSTFRELPQRVPAEPDVPALADPPPGEPVDETPALARIASHLRRAHRPSSRQAPGAFDVKAIRAAVREVDGVRDASVRATSEGAHSLRLELSRGADAAEVSRRVALLLQDRMGLDAAMTPSEAEVASGRLTSGARPGPRVVVESVEVTMSELEATVHVRLTVGNRAARGVAAGPAVNGYLLRLCAMATASAVDELLAVAARGTGPARCFIEHAALVPFGPTQVAVVVLLLTCGGWVEQLAGSVVVTGDDRHAMVQATLAAGNRRLEALLT